MADLAASFPVGAVAEGLFGLGQTLFSGAGRKERDLEKFSGTYKPNAGIMDVYNKALAKYSTNPYTSSLYNQQTKNINRNVNTGISALQDRRSAIGGISSLVQGANDASLKAAAGAEQQQSQNLGQLGQAAGAAAAEQYKPFEMKYNLLSAKAAGANKVQGAGLQNIFGGLSGVQDYQSLNKIYGNRRTLGTGNGNGTSYMTQY